MVRKTRLESYAEIARKECRSRTLAVSVAYGHYYAACIWDHYCKACIWDHYSKACIWDHCAYCKACAYDPYRYRDHDHNREPRGRWHDPHHIPHHGYDHAG